MSTWGNITRFIGSTPLPGSSWGRRPGGLLGSPYKESSPVCGVSAPLTSSPLSPDTACWGWGADTNHSKGHQCRRLTEQLSLREPAASAAGHQLSHLVRGWAPESARGGGRCSALLPPALWQEGDRQAWQEIFPVLGCKMCWHCGKCEVNVAVCALQPLALVVPGEGTGAQGPN